MAAVCACMRSFAGCWGALFAGRVAPAAFFLPCAFFFGDAAPNPVPDPAAIVGRVVCALRRPEPRCSAARGLLPWAWKRPWSGSGATTNAEGVEDDAATPSSSTAAASRQRRARVAAMLQRPPSLPSTAGSLPARLCPQLQETEAGVARTSMHIWRHAAAVTALVLLGGASPSSSASSPARVPSAYVVAPHALRAEPRCALPHRTPQGQRAWGRAVRCSPPRLALGPAGGAGREQQRATSCPQQQVVPTRSLTLRMHARCVAHAALFLTRRALSLRAA